MSLRSRCGGRSNLPWKLVVVPIFLFLLSSFALAAEPVFKGEDKISPEIRYDWQQSMESAGLNREVFSIIKLSKKPDKKLIKELKEAGFVSSNYNKRVITGKFKLVDLPKIASLEGVLSVTAPSRVYLK